MWVDNISILQPVTPVVHPRAPPASTADLSHIGIMFLFDIVCHSSGSILLIFISGLLWFCRYSTCSGSGLLWHDLLNHVFVDVNIRISTKLLDPLLNSTSCCNICWLEPSHVTKAKVSDSCLTLSNSATTIQEWPRGLTPEKQYDIQLSLISSKNSLWYSISVVLGHVKSSIYPSVNASICPFINPLKPGACSSFCY